MSASVHYSSEKMDWATPWPLFDALDREFEFTLDVCASKENKKCAKYFTEQDDALSRIWEGSCFCNPPYGRALPAWIDKAARSAAQGAQVVCLVPARTDTKWWARAWEASAIVRFVRGRITFDGAPSGAPFPSAILVMRRRPFSRTVELWDQP